MDQSKSLSLNKITSVKHFKYSSAAERNEWKKAYIEANDPTGYLFGEKWVEGGFEHWYRLSRTSAFKKVVPVWQEELEVKLQSIGVRALVMEAASGEKASGAAARWLASRGWIPKEDKRTKDSKRKAERAAEEIKQDFERLGLKAVK